MMASLNHKGVKLVTTLVVVPVGYENACLGFKKCYTCLRILGLIL